MEYTTPGSTGTRVSRLCFGTWRFGRGYFDRLAAVEGDTGGRSVLFEAPETRLVETGDPGVVRDVDRPGDL